MYKLLKYDYKGGPGSGPNEGELRGEYNKKFKEYEKTIEIMRSQGYKVEKKFNVSSSSEVYVVIGEKDNKTYFMKPMEKMSYNQKVSDFHKSFDKGVDLHCATSDLSASLGFDNVPASTATIVNGKLVLLSEEIPDSKTILGSPNEPNYDSMEKLSIIDAVIGQRDGHKANYVVSNKDSKTYGIDYNVAGSSGEAIFSTPIRKTAEKAMDIGDKYPEKYDAYYRENMNQNRHLRHYIPSFMAIKKNIINSLPKTLKMASNQNSELQSKVQKRYNNLLVQANNPENDFGEYVLIEYMHLWK